HREIPSVLPFRVPTRRPCTSSAAARQALTEKNSQRHPASATMRKRYTRCQCSPRGTRVARSDEQALWLSGYSPSVSLCLGGSSYISIERKPLEPFNILCDHSILPGTSVHANGCRSSR